MVGYVRFFSLLICLSLPVTSYAEVKTVESVDRGNVSKITVRLDKVGKYDLVKKTSRNIVISINDKSPDAGVYISNKSKLIKSFEQIDGGGTVVSFNVVFRRNISNISVFSLKSPPRILLNIDVSSDGNLPEEEYAVSLEPIKKSVTKNKEKGAGGRTGINNEGNDETNMDKGKAYRFEGLEDVVTPAFDPFIEIFGTDEAISIYHIKLPPVDELPDYLGRARRVGDYDLKNRYLINAARNIGNGDYERALELLDDVSQEVKETENYSLLRADAEFQKALFEGKKSINEAMKFYKEMIIKYPKPKHVPWAYMQVGTGSFYLGKYRSAARSFKAVIDKYKNSPYMDNAKLLFAKTLSRQGKFEDAIRIYKTFIEESPQSPFLAEAVFGAARNMTQKGRYRKAVALFETAVQRWPQYALSDIDALMSIGESNNFMRKFDKALKYYTKVVNLYPGHEPGGRAMARIGDIYMSRGKFETAKKIFLEIEAIYPGSYGALIGKIRIADFLASKNAETDEVMGFYESVYKKYPKSPIAPIATLKAGMLLAKRNDLKNAFHLYLKFKKLYSKNKLINKVFEETLKVFTALIEEYGEKKDCLEVLRLSKKYKRLIEAIDDGSPDLIAGNCYFRYGKYEEAVSNYNKIKAGDEFETALLMKGKSLYHVGRIEEAVPVMEQFINLFPDNREGIGIRYLLAQGYEKNGGFAEAIEFYRYFIKNGPDDDMKADANMKLAGLLKKTGDIDGSDNALKAAIKLYTEKNNAGRSKAYFLLGESLYTRGKFKAALTSYNNAIENAKEKKYEEAQYKAAFCLYKTGRIKAARELFKDLSEEAGDPFWKSLSEKTMKDIISKVPI